MSRPHGDRAGALEWFTSVDHKKIGILYIVTAAFFFVLGGLESLVIRLQLASPRNDLVSPDLYNQIFTMHGTTMIFLVAMPLLTGFANYFVPLMIGARDVAFPRLNALAYWLLPCGGLLMYYSFGVGGAPAIGWFGYAPLSERAFHLGEGVEYWILALLILGVSSVAGAINILVTVFTLRIRGMSLQRLPLFVWMVAVTSILIVLALPALNSAIVLLLIDRAFDAAVFAPARGGNALLWQHFFWIFGHPEVYILVLPAFGMISEVIPVFARRPIFGYGFVAGSTVAIGVLSLGVWAHHMFTAGMGFGPNTFFMAATLLIAVPTGIKIFNWTFTMRGGSLRLETPMLFALGFLIEFVLGGLSGVTLAIVPIDWQVSDTYYVVAHFHYVIFGGTVFGVLAGFYYWFPKMTGRMLDERLGKLHFWLTVAGFNATFFVQHFLGLMGMPRRVYTYPDRPGWGTLNMISTVGAMILGLSVLVLLYNVYVSRRRGAPAGANPWRAWTLEWATTSPPPHDNFVRVPPVRGRRPLWDLDNPLRADHGHHPTAADDGRRPNAARLAVLLLIASEATFFVLLFAAYLTFNLQPGPGPTAATSLDVGTTWVFTILLLSSSLTAHLAERALAKDERGSFFGWLAATLALGGAFLAGQTVEYLDLYERGITIDRNLFGTTFFTLTGFHGLHVLAGLISWGVVLALAARRHLTAGRAHVATAIGYYWHFVDVVWVFVFSIVYLRVLG